MGGTDFDRRIVEIFQARYQDKYGTTLLTDDEGAEKFLPEAEDLKRTLSKREKADVVVNGDAGPLKVEISRQEFEEAISTFIAKTATLIDGVLMEANAKPEDIHQVLLVGGSTRVPLVQEQLTKIFGKEPTRAVNVDEAVALGAAVCAGLKAYERAWAFGISWGPASW